MVRGGESRVSQATRYVFAFIFHAKGILTFFYFILLLSQAIQEEKRESQIISIFIWYVLKFGDFVRGEYMYRFLETFQDVFREPEMFQNKILQLITPLQMAALVACFPQTIPTSSQFLVPCFSHAKKFFSFITLPDYFTEEFLTTIS